MLARELEETKLSAHQKIRPDGGWFLIEATVQDTWQLRWWLLAKIGDLVVLEPDDLGAEILNRLKSGLSTYHQNS